MRGGVAYEVLDTGIIPPASPEHTAYLARTRAILSFFSPGALLVAADAGSSHSLLGLGILLRRLVTMRATAEARLLSERRGNATE